MKSFLLSFILVLGVSASNLVFAGDCEKGVVGCESAGYDATKANINSNATMMHSNLELNAKLNALRAANDLEAHQTAQKMLADEQAKQKAAQEAEDKKSVVQKIKEKLSLD